MLICLQYGLAAQSSSSEQNIPIEITSDGLNSYQDGIAYAEDNVIVRYGLDTIYADQITFDEARREIICRGNVRIYVENRTYRGEFLSYNLDGGQVASEDFRTASERILAYGDSIESPKENHFIIERGGITTENREDPSYTLRANTLEIYPGDLAVFRNVGVFIGPVPVMWLPYMAIPLDGEFDGLDFTVGSAGQLGTFVRGAYTTALTQAWDVSLHASYFTRRGFGGGADFFYEPREGDRSEFRSFYLRDQDNGVDLDPFERPVAPDPDRFRFSYKNRSKIADDIYARADINIWSDRHVTEDFFREEFRNEREPDNFLEATYYDANFTLNMLARFQANNLFSPTERKPEAILEFKRQQFFETFLTYEGEASVVNFSQDFDRDIGANGGVQPTEYSAVRYDMFHQLLYPKQYFDWLNFTPFVGGRATMYDRTNDFSAPGSITPDDETGRLVVNAGFDASFKISKTWDNVRKPEWGIEGLRHVIEPYMTAQYVLPSETNSDFLGFDNRVANTRLAPLTFSAFNSIDSINKLGAVRHGIRQSLQTKRDGRNYDLLNWNLYTQANIIRPEGNSLTGSPNLVATTPAFTDVGLLADDVYSHVFNEFEFRPLPWLTYQAYAAAPVIDNTFTELTHSLNWQLHPAVELSLSHQYLDGISVAGVSFTESQRVMARMFWRLNENWQFEPTVGYEGDDGIIDEASFTVYRDLRAWKAALSAVYTDNRLNGQEYLVFLSLTLKAFPALNISIDN